MQYAFPYDRIKKDSRIIIYGAGQVGCDLLEEAEKTAYCTIVCVLDKVFETYQISRKNFYPPEYIEKLSGSEYDVVLIAQAYESRSALIRTFLLSKGVPEEKIMIYSTALIVGKRSFDELEVPDDGGSILRIGVLAPASLGDCLLYILPLIELRRMCPDKLIIDVLSANQKLFAKLPFVDNALPYAASLEYEKYDAIIFFHAFTWLKRLKPEKVRRLSPALADYFMAVIDFMKNRFPLPSYGMRSNLFHYFSVIGQHRVTVNDIANTFSFNKDTIAPFPISVSLDILTDHDLVRSGYILLLIDERVINSAIAKSWPNAHFNELIHRINEQFPQFTLVLIGNVKAESSFTGSFLDLRGKTTMEELAALLKYSLLLVSTEGGVVHLNRSVGGVSCCLFGPTLPKLIGYSENINLRGESACDGGCEWMLPKNNGWSCAFSEKVSPCMKDLSPAFVFGQINEFLSCRNDYRIELSERRTLESAAELLNGKCALIGRNNDFLILPYADKVSSLIIFDSDLSAEPIDSQAPININYAVQLKKSGIDVQYGTMHNIPAAENTFDQTLCLTRAADIDPVLYEMMRITKPDGTIMILIDNNTIDIYKKRLQGNKL